MKAMLIDRMFAPVTVVAIILVSAIAVAAMPSPTEPPIPATVSAPQGVLPSIVHHAGQQAVNAYRAALQFPDVLQAVPCTCGCVASLGHESNFDCYIEEMHANGRVTYSTHGLYCTVCQFITRDAVAGAAAGMSADELHAMILDRYGPGR